MNPECSLCGNTYGQSHIWTCINGDEICQECLSLLYHNMIELKGEDPSYWKFGQPHDFTINNEEDLEYLGRGKGKDD